MSVQFPALKFLLAMMYGKWKYVMLLKCVLGHFFRHKVKTMKALILILWVLIYAHDMQHCYTNSVNKVCCTLL